MSLSLKILVTYFAFAELVGPTIAVASYVWTDHKGHFTPITKFGIGIAAFLIITGVLGLLGYVLIYMWRM